MPGWTGAVICNFCASLPIPSNAPTWPKVTDPLGAQADPVGYAYADVQYVKDGTGTQRQIDRSLICLNPIKRWKVGFDGNLAVYDLRYTIAHEIGHAIGLNHPEPHGQLMSRDYLESFRSLQAGDVNGAVRIYGARTVQ